MKNNLVEIKFHGNIFSGLKETYKLSIKSVGEAMHAINIISKQRLYSNLLENDKKGIKYKVLVNGRDFLAPEPLDINNPQTIKNSELIMNLPNLKTVDIVPVIEGADSDIGAIIAGVLLVVVGIVLAFTGFGAPLGAAAGWVGGALIVGGIGLVAAGVINLLSSPPQFEDFREIAGGGKSSYLFNGPQNTVNEGGPVPVGYGRLLIGSHTIAASYELSDVSAAEIITT